MQKESNSKDVTQYVGPYKLDKTLGKGQTGIVNQISRSQDYTIEYEVNTYLDYLLLNLIIVLYEMS